MTASETSLTPVAGRLADRLAVSFLGFVSRRLLRFGPIGLRMFLLRAAVRFTWCIRPNVF
ncbi:MAG: hypothetical protein OXH05_04675 [Acidobacteria bacterium]|nr:hypothetical protein [Acidobacteriota bacterium]